MFGRQLYGFLVKFYDVPTQKSNINKNAATNRARFAHHFPFKMRKEVIWCGFFGHTYNNMLCVKHTQQNLNKFPYTTRTRITDSKLKIFIANYLF